MIKGFIGVGVLQRDDKVFLRIVAEDDRERQWFVDMPLQGAVPQVITCDPQMLTNALMSIVDICNDPQAAEESGLLEAGSCAFADEIKLMPKRLM